MNGEILAPSDLRKNQATRLHLRNPGSPWLTLLNHRFSVDPSKAREYCRNCVRELTENCYSNDQDGASANLMSEAIDAYFGQPLSTSIDYVDFSIANVLYAGLARLNGNSIRAAAGIMAGVMSIPDDVIVNDDSSLFLGAITQSGFRLFDEGEIVFWGNEIDPLVDVFFLDPQGRASVPYLCVEAWKTILTADLIILSSGTLWSSLIPTYASKGFKAAVGASKALIAMVMNRIPDKDSPGQSASDIINALVPKYFDPERLHVVADIDGHARMRTLDDSALPKVASFNSVELSTSEDPPDKHNPARLASALGTAFFRDYLDSDFYLFDYDDTLVGRGRRCPDSSKFNVEALVRLNSLTDIGICTGNTIKAVQLTGFPAGAATPTDFACKPILVFADGGINEYTYNTLSNGSSAGNGDSSARCIWPSALLPQEGNYSVARITESLFRVGISPATIENRGDALLAIRPVTSQDRGPMLQLLQHLLDGSGLVVRESGTTTIEICKPVVSKSCALKSFFSNCNRSARVTYIGDELHSGNDRDILNLSGEQTELKCLHVGGPTQTAFFLSVLLEHLVSHVQR
jgi:2-phospho-L-lactate transferase/gluconeogenesis factor (CofD/UPF0052 family)